MTQSGPPPARVDVLSFPDVLRVGWQIIQLDERAMDTARGPGITLLMALSVAAIGGAIGGLTGGLPGMIMMALFGVLNLVVSVGIGHLLALAFGGQGSFEELFKVMGVGSLVRWVSFIPVIGMLTGIWLVVILAVAIRRVHQVSTGTAVLIVLIPALLTIAGSMLLFLGILTSALLMS